MLGDVCILVVSKNKQLFWKLWRPTIFGYGMHCFRLPRPHNDINVLEQSSIFTNLAEGCAHLANYLIHGHDYTMGYYPAL
jgi:hypothetical protein